MSGGAAGPPSRSLTACLIVRDEERLLPGALDSIREAADEIVVVDTGSRDRTTEIARAAGAHVATHAWQDDFAAARNAAHAVARGAWLLWLDADERLAGAGAARAVRALVADVPADVGGFVIERHDVLVHPDTGRTMVNPVGMVRLYRNDPRIRWLGAVHERPGDSIVDAGLALRIATSVRLTHLVLATAPERLRAKQERYRAMLERELARDPRDRWARYYLGKTLWYLGAHGAALDAFAEVASPAAPTPATPAGERAGGRFLRAAAHAMRASIHLERGALDDALRETDASLALAPAQSLAWAVRGDVLYAAGAFADAAAAFGRVRLALAPAPEGAAGLDAVPGDLYMLPERRAYKLGCCALALGELDDAAREFESATHANPADAGGWLGLAHVARLRGDATRARRFGEAAAGCDPTWVEPRAFLDALG